jgi:hypothetical protein
VVFLQAKEVSFRPRVPSREDMINIVTVMYQKDGLTMSDIETLVDTFPNQG